MPASRKDFLDIEVSIECELTLKHVRDMIGTYSQIHRTDKYSHYSSIIWPVWLNGWVFVFELSGCAFWLSCNHWNFRFGACFQQWVPWYSGSIQESIELEFTLKCLRHMIGTYTQMHSAYKYLQNSSVIWLVWLKFWVFLYQLCDCGLEFSCGEFNFRFCVSFEQGVPFHSGKYWVWIHPQTRTWHDKNIQSNALYR